MRVTFFFILGLVSTVVFSQKKELTIEDVALWNSIEQMDISSNGKYILYTTRQGEKDAVVHLKTNKGETLFSYKNAEKASFSYNSNYLFFNIKPAKDSIKDLKRKKVKKDKFPKDTLAIYNIKENKLRKFPNVNSYEIPKKWEGYIAYTIEQKKEKSKKDSIKKYVKKTSKENGYHLILTNLTSNKNDTIYYATSFHFAEKKPYITVSSTGKDSINSAIIFHKNLIDNRLDELYNKEKQVIKQLSISNSGENIAFITEVDSSKMEVKPRKIYHWNKNKGLQHIDVSNIENSGYIISEHFNPSFSDNDHKMYFGYAKPPLVQDTLKVDDEIVNVEVWTYNEPRLYTVQEMQVKNDKKKSYTAAYNLTGKQNVTIIETEQFDNVIFSKNKDSNFAVISNELPYLLESQWTGNRARDYAFVDVTSGETKAIMSKKVGRFMQSPSGEYLYGYSAVDSSWIAYSFKNNKLLELTKGKVFFDEENDSPTFPSAYGSPGWVSKNEVLLYDRFDIWKYNVDNGSSERLTYGREKKLVYRYQNLEKENDFISTTEKWILEVFDENTKQAGYAHFNPKNNKIKVLFMGDIALSTPIKARENSNVIFTRESFTEFPNIISSTTDFKNLKTISDVNPQQKEYNWGTTELVKWTSLDGETLEGIVVKPENFNPTKKYPLLVNFYEKSSNTINNHRAPSYGRSSINYSFYTSRGYVIFNPNISYKIGYPGESAFNCVIPGINSLIEKGYIDEKNIGVQGHSWGGYQIAYLVTRTSIFKAAESGAPVVNMISAYGGIRWWTGLSRQFQYEHTQSRIGGTPWEFPLRYIENSPIFTIDKITTPLLIMHNDADGHVPWYQGIEFFVALRRLGKPAWMLNYNDEPHWPLKLQNRIDFNTRLSQFFDYYLKGAKKPLWMENGVPAIEKGINQHLEYIEND